LRASVSPAVVRTRPAILLVFQQALGIEALDHISDARLRDAEAGRDVDYARVALGIDQLEDALEVILDRS
jgi:hypothetical protein